MEGEDGPLLVAPDEALQESHRHFSHLMDIYPLGIIHIEGTDRDRRIIEASLEQMDELGSKLWTGYSFAWMACMRARVGQAQSALENLRKYMDFTLQNGFHVNGPQTRKELSDYNSMRAFTLEGNFGAAQAVHDMFLQSWGGRVRIFPATPEEWEDVSFSRFRAEGGYVVDAERIGGKTVKVEITSTADQVLRLKDPFDKREFESNLSLKRTGNDELQCRLKQGQTLRLVLAGAKE